jgi:hypothetical protein
LRGVNHQLPVTGQRVPPAAKKAKAEKESATESFCHLTRTGLIGVMR